MGRIQAYYWYYVQICTVSFKQGRKVWPSIRRESMGQQPCNFQRLWENQLFSPTNAAPGSVSKSFCCALDCSILPRPISSNSIKSSMVLAGSAKTLGKVSLVFQNNLLGMIYIAQKCRNSVVYHGVLPHEWQAKPEGS